MAVATLGSRGAESLCGGDSLDPVGPASGANTVTQAVPDIFHCHLSSHQTTRPTFLRHVTLCFYRKTQGLSTWFLDLAVGYIKVLIFRITVFTDFKRP